MASAKQIKARKLFAKRVKRGDFRKSSSGFKPIPSSKLRKGTVSHTMAIRAESKKKSYDTLVAQKGTSLKNTIEFWEQAERDSIEAGHDAEGGKQKAYFENQAELIHSMLKDFKKSLPLRGKMS